MIRIFHGDDLEKSRDAFNQFLGSFKGDVLRLDSKQIDLNKINNLYYKNTEKETTNITIF